MPLSETIEKPVINSTMDMVVIHIPMEKILYDSAINCRGDITPLDVDDLVEDIRERGLMQPVVVRPLGKDGYEYCLVAGYRRYMAFRVLGKKTIPAVVKDIDEVIALEYNLNENIKRKSLNILQEAKGLERMWHLGETLDAIAKRFGVTIGWVIPRIKLLTMPEDIQQVAAAGFLTQEQIRDIDKLPSLEMRYEAVRGIKEAKMRGEKRRIQIIEKIKDKDKEQTKRTIRGREEIIAMQSHLRDTIGNGIATRALGWACGFISNEELFFSLKDHTDELGLDYVIPLDWPASEKLI